MDDRSQQMRDSDKYMPEARYTIVWPMYIYELFHASLDKPKQRTAVSLGVGVTTYLIGLTISIPIGFTQTYLATLPIAWLSLACAFYMGRLRWLTTSVLPLVKQVRPVFTIENSKFKNEADAVGKRATNLWVIIPLTLLVLIATWGAIAIAYFFPDQLPAIYLAALRPVTFPVEWFTGPNLMGKMLLFDWLLTPAVAYIVPVIYATGVGMIDMLLTVGKWPVVPVPAYVATRVSLAVSYFLAGGLYYAIAVLIAVLLYGGQADLASVGLVSLFSAVGLFCILGPIIGSQRLVERARQQLATTVASTYYQSIYPIAASESESDHASQTMNLRKSISRLLRLQELMQAANETNGFERQLGLLVPAILSQTIPFLGFFINAAINRFF